MGLGKKLKKLGGKALNIATGGVAGIGVGGPNKGLLGKILRPGETHMPDLPSASADQAKIDQFMADTQNRYTQQQEQLKNVLNQQRQNAEQSLTTGPEGEQMRQQFNRLGLLNSGAFNTDLAQKFADIQKGSDLSLMQQGLGTTDVLQNIAEGGLQRQLGLEDTAYNTQLQNVLAKRRKQAGLQQQLLGIGGNILGNLAGHGMGGGGGGNMYSDPTGGGGWA